MCILVLHQPGKVLTVEEMRSYGRTNPDGFGYMFAKNENELVIKKGMNLEKIISLYRKDVKDFKDSIFCVHFRASSGGEKSTSNCHPFRISTTTGMAHNGILFSPPHGEVRSDTRMYNDDTLIPIGDDIVTNASLQTLVLDDIGASNKIAVMNSKNQFHIFNAQLGEWEDGIWRSFKAYKYSNYSHSYSSREMCSGCKKLFATDFMYKIENPTGRKLYFCGKCGNERVGKYFNLYEGTQGREYQYGY